MFPLFCAAVAMASASSSAQTTPGIAVKVTRAGLDYLANVAEGVIPEILTDIAFPDPPEYYSAKVSGMRITHMERPRLFAKYNSSVGGIVATGRVTYVNLTANYEYGDPDAWFSVHTVGDMDMHLHNFTINAIVDLDEVHGGEPQLKLRNCSIEIGTTSISGMDESMSAIVLQGVLNTADTVYNDYIGSAICGIVIKALDSASAQSSSNGNNGNGNEESLFCGAGEQSNIGRRAKFPMQYFTLNMSLTKDPVFQADHLAVDFNGTVLYRERQSALTYARLHPSPYPATGGKMLRIVISSMVPNSFFSHVFAYSLGDFHQSVSLSDVSGPLKLAALALCPNCHLIFRGKLQRPPLLLIKKGGGAGNDGVQIYIKILLEAYLRAYQTRHTFFSAQAYVKVQAHPYVRSRTNRLHAQTHIEKIEIRPHRTSGIIGTLFGAILRDSASQINRDNRFDLRPYVDNAMEKAFGEGGGIPLPHVCGIQFENSRMTHIANAMIVDTDINYEATPLVLRFRKVLESIREIMKTQTFN